MKAQDGNRLGTVSSASPGRGLHAARVIDHYTLVIHPLTLGCGGRMFDGPPPLTQFTLTGSVTTTKGVIVADDDRDRRGAP